MTDVRGSKAQAIIRSKLNRINAGGNTPITFKETTTTSRSVKKQTNFMESSIDMEMANSKEREKILDLFRHSPSSPSFNVKKNLHGSHSEKVLLLNKQNLTSYYLCFIKRINWNQLE